MTPLLLGHRGARLTVPENTFAAFDRALEDGCDGFEFDVRRTLDARSVICHDPHLFGLEVAHAVYPELAARCGAVGLRTLEEVIARYASRAWLDIELKVAGLEDALLAALREHPPQRGFVVSSFFPEILSALHTRDSSLPMGFICERRDALACWRELPVQYLIVHRSLLSQELVEDTHRTGDRVFVWTVNQREEMARFADWGVDAIISDDTALLGRLFRQQ